MRTYLQAVAYAEYLRVHPSADVLAGGHCQGVARDIVGAAGWAPSALDAWNKIPAAHKFDLAHAKPGMIGYAAYRDANGNPKEYGHAFVLATGGYVYTTDNPVMYRLNKSPLGLITGTSGWHMPLLGFIDWTPSGSIATAPVVAPAPTYTYRQNKQVYSSKMKLGVINSDSVWNISLSLYYKHYLAAPNDDFTTTLQAAVKKFQVAQGWSGSQADGIPGPMTTARLGLTWVVG